jgi:hypothetical protein
MATPSMVGTASSLLSDLAGRSALLRREAACRIGADNLLAVIGLSILI